MRLQYLIPFALSVAMLFANCKKESTTPAPVTPKQFTFFSPGGSCGGRVQSGNFVVGRPLLGSNKTISVRVDVATLGPFEISTDTINGIVFSKRDVFTTTGVQTVALQGSGTPVRAGVFDYILRGNSGDTCTTYATIIAAVTASTFSCKINGVFSDFSRNFSSAVLYNPGVDMKFSGSLADGSNHSLEVWLQHPSLNPLTIGSYTVNTAGQLVKGQFTDAALNSWIGQTESAAQSDPFTINITAVSSYDVTGTFSGSLKENAGAGPGVKVIREGVFSFSY